MRHTKNTLDAAKRGKSILLLGTALVHAVDLHRQAKQAHWNVGGPNFTALHELFDRIATAADKDADLLAERLMALGGTADARVATVANRTTLGVYPLEARKGEAHIDALSTALATFGSVARDAVNQAADWGDQDTADLLAYVSAGLDKNLWLVESHGSAA
ncbi:MAG TPA: DNA starvation/stationary phase protection protein Dps [Steroidobacteraceae bacterium]|jgi:starvation-inducible DNA-binding protein